MDASTLERLTSLTALVSVQDGVLTTSLPESVFEPLWAFRTACVKLDTLGFHASRCYRIELFECTEFNWARTGRDISGTITHVQELEGACGGTLVSFRVSGRSWSARDEQAVHAHSPVRRPMRLRDQNE